MCKIVLLSRMWKTLGGRWHLETDLFPLYDALQGMKNQHCLGAMMSEICSAQLFKLYARKVQYPWIVPGYSSFHFTSLILHI